MKHLADSERLNLLEEYLGNDESRYAFCKRHQISESCIKDWLIKFGMTDKIKRDVMAIKNDPKVPDHYLA